MDDFEKEIKLGFLDEAAQAVADVEQCFLTLEEHPEDKPTLDKIFRLAHNLKGSAKAVGFDEMGHFTHELETYMLALKTGLLAVKPQTVDLLLRCNDQILYMVDQLRQDLAASVDCSDLIAELQKAQAGQEDEEFELEEEIAEESFAPAPVPGAFEFTENNERHLAPSAPVAKAAAPPVAKASAPPSSGSHSQVDESIRVSLSRVEKLLNSVGEMVILQSVLREKAALDSSDIVKKTIQQMGKVAKEVQDMSMSLRMVPVKPTFQKMQRIVRDTAQALNKQVHLNLVGEETELDKTILERINDPLVHLIRNSVDHGIESTQTRLANGKPAEGQVSLSAYHQSGKLVLEIKDDGGGLDVEKLKAIAIKKGVIAPSAQLSEREAFNLIFAPGFSTKAEVTDISGRGVGMDVVRTNIEELNGDILIQSSLGKGTTFKIFLPLTLAIIDGMVVRVGEERFVIPLSHVYETVKPSANDLRSTVALGEVFLLRGENLPTFHLGQLLGRKVMSKASEQIAIVVRTAEVPFVLLVDDIIGQYQVVIKQLGEEMQGLRGVAGSTILGDGRPALILEPIDLIKKEVKAPSKASVRMAS